ncbi:hypothetical protein [Streptomyces sp. AN091965]|uniref:hypothetical protein n=1 Tax=Streptomyces sp. AN091965 TaxID=2927803 RepID=UPI001F60F074|nr:hypothetical protein [Streptomyces sp. AN091965]MCI3929968.1 hypothetical protein [Streptomyces sp. AN091965]
MSDVGRGLRLFVVPALSTVTIQQRSGTVCVWCPRTLDGGEGVDLGALGDWHLRACPACHEVQGRVLATYLDWYDHGIACLYCPLGPCERGKELGAQHLAAREQAGKPELSCVGCRTPIAPGEAIRPHLWQGLGGPVFSYLHARRCPQ